MSDRRMVVLAKRILVANEAVKSVAVLGEGREISFLHAPQLFSDRVPEDGDYFVLFEGERDEVLMTEAELRAAEGRPAA